MMDPKMLGTARQLFYDGVFRDRQNGMGWGTLAAKYKVSKRNLQRLIKKLEVQKTK